MSKDKGKSAFFCRECGYENAKWMGKCPGCGIWNSFVEERSTKKSSVPASGQSAFQRLKETQTSSIDCLSPVSGRHPVLLEDIEVLDQDRWDSGSVELNRVLGGGVVPGSLVLLSGEPGIGKSTFMLQMAHSMGQGAKVLYISGEESLRQIKLRAERLGCSTTAGIHVMAEVSVDAVGQEALNQGFNVLIIDSIQTMMLDDLQSAPGSVSQVRESASFLMRLAKDHGIAVFMVGHVTKDGTIAGPRVLEHMVDTVLYFDGDQYHIYRLLRAIKNRFGPSNEIGVFEMRGSGLVEVRNLSQIFLEGGGPAIGSAITVTMEGTRPLLVEIQALVTPSLYGQPRRTVNGLDYNRLLILLAVLDKRIGFAFASKDVFVNVAGGLKISEPAVDMAVAGALLSALKDKIIPKMVMVGELGLTGEVRGIAQIEQRILEAKDFGFHRCVYPEANEARLKQLNLTHKANPASQACEKDPWGFYPVKTVEDMIEILFSTE